MHVSLNHPVFQTSSISRWTRFARFNPNLNVNTIDGSKIFYIIHEIRQLCVLKIVIVIPILILLDDKIIIWAIFPNTEKFTAFSITFLCLYLASWISQHGNTKEGIQHSCRVNECWQVSNIQYSITQNNCRFEYIRRYLSQKRREQEIQDTIFHHHTSTQVLLRVGSTYRIPGCLLLLYQNHWSWYEYTLPNLISSKPLTFQ